MNEQRVETLKLTDFYSSMVRAESNREDREFCFVSSRTTAENIEIIEEVCVAIGRSFRDYIPQETDPFLSKTKQCVQAFKFLVLNTKFKVQDLFLEDINDGYLVNMIASFSPYILVEVIFSLEYESALTESILHFPLDLCSEILEVIPRCLEVLSFDRGSKFLASIILNAYKRLILTRDVGTQTESIDAACKALVGNVQELISQFNADRFLRLEKMPKSEKYKKIGFLLKKIIRMVKFCLLSKTKRIDLTPEMTNMYSVSFGNHPVEKIDDGDLERYLSTIDRELINLVLKKIKEINCNIYMEWAEFDDEENPSISLQRAIGLDCFYFVEDLIEDERMEQYGHLIECLNQISSKPELKTEVEDLAMPELILGVNEGKKEYLIQILHR